MDIRKIQAEMNAISDTFKDLNQQKVSMRIHNAVMNADPEHAKKVSQGKKNYHANLTEDEAREYQKIRGEGNKKRWASYTEEERIARNAKLKGLGAIPVVTPFGEFACGKYFNEYIMTLPDIPNFKWQDKAMTLPHLYYKKEDGPGAPTYEEVRYTPYGTTVSNNDYFSMRKLFNQLVVTGVISTDEYKNAKVWWSKMSKQHPDKYYKKIEVKREWFNLVRPQ